MISRIICHALLTVDLQNQMQEKRLAIKSISPAL